MPTDRTIWMILLPLMAVYAIWRAVVLLKRGRYGFCMALGFLALFCLYELTWQILQLSGVIRS